MFSKLPNSHTHCLCFFWLLFPTKKARCIRVMSLLPAIEDRTHFRSNLVVSKRRSKERIAYLLMISANATSMTSPSRINAGTRVVLPPPIKTRFAPAQALFFTPSLQTRAPPLAFPPLLLNNHRTNLLNPKRTHHRANTWAAGETKQTKNTRAHS
jgi:hypothetical protein